MVGLDQHDELPAEFLSLVPRRLESVLAEPVMRIGGWTDPTEGPLVLALTATGDLVSILAVPDAQLPQLGEMLESIDGWLSTLRLRELSKLSGNHESFYEGLWNLSPDTSITLSTTRRYVVLTAASDVLDEQPLFDLLPNAEIDVRYHDVFHAPSGPAVIRRRSGRRVETAASADPSRSVDELELLPIDIRQPDEPVEEVGHLEVGPTELASPEPEPIEIPPVEIPPHQTLPDDIEPLESDSMPEPVIDLVAEPTIDPPATIDLTYQTVSLPEQPSFAQSGDATVDLRPGQTFLLHELPTLFDPLDDELQSVSDEIFTVRDHLVLVAKLPERRRATSFEERYRFRWDASIDHIKLLGRSGHTGTGTRSVLLFVETDRQPGIATFVGTLNRISSESNSPVGVDSAWFSITPSLESELFRTLKKGRLPQTAADLVSGGLSSDV